MKNYLLEKIGGFTILIMVAFVLAVPIALAESELSKAWQKIISGLDAQYILVCDRGGYGGVLVPSSMRLTTRKFPWA